MNRNVPPSHGQIRFPSSTSLQCTFPGPGNASASFLDARRTLCSWLTRQEGFTFRLHFTRPPWQTFCRWNPVFTNIFFSLQTLTHHRCHQHDSRPALVIANFTQSAKILAKMHVLMNWWRNCTCDCGSHKSIPSFLAKSIGRKTWAGSIVTDKIHCIEAFSVKKF